MPPMTKYYANLPLSAWLTVALKTPAKTKNLTIYTTERTKSFTASAFRAICSRLLPIRHALALSVSTFTEIAAIAVLHTTYFSDYRTPHYCKLSLQALAFV